MGIFRERESQYPPVPMAKKNIDALVATCRALIADGHVNALEYEFLLRWFEQNEKNVGRHPFKAIYERLCDALSDGVVDEDEERDLLGLIADLVETSDKAFVLSVESRRVEPKSPYTEPEPVIEFYGAQMVVTGVFDFGDRAAVMAAIHARGGTVQKAITKQTNYVVVGSHVSPDWAYGNFGTKIDKACDYINQGVPIAIIRESRWIEAMDSK